MVQSKTAIKPDVFKSFIDIDKRTVGEKRSELSPDDISLSALANHDGWRVLNEYIEHLKGEMDVLIATAISNGNSFEDVGRLTVVANLAKEKLYAIQKRVIDSKDVGEQAGQ